MSLPNNAIISQGNHVNRIISCTIQGLKDVKGNRWRFEAGENYAQVMADLSLQGANIDDPNIRGAGPNIIGTQGTLTLYGNFGGALDEVLKKVEDKNATLYQLIRWSEGISEKMREQGKDFEYPITLTITFGYIGSITKTISCIAYKVEFGLEPDKQTNFVRFQLTSGIESFANTYNNKQTFRIEFGKTTFAEVLRYIYTPYGQERYIKNKSLFASETGIDIASDDPYLNKPIENIVYDPNLPPKDGKLQPIYDTVKNKDGTTRIVVRRVSKDSDLTLVPFSEANKGRNHNQIIDTFLDILTKLLTNQHRRVLTVNVSAGGFRIETIPIKKVQVNSATQKNTRVLLERTEKELIFFHITDEKLKGTPIVSGISNNRILENGQEGLIYVDLDTDMMRPEVFQVEAIALETKYTTRNLLNNIEANSGLKVEKNKVSIRQPYYLLNFSLYFSTRDPEGSSMTLRMCNTPLTLVGRDSQNNSIFTSIRGLSSG